MFLPKKFPKIIFGGMAKEPSNSRDRTALSTEELRTIAAELRGLAKQFDDIADLVAELPEPIQVMGHKNAMAAISAIRGWRSGVRSEADDSALKSGHPATSDVLAVAEKANQLGSETRRKRHHSTKSVQ